MTNEDGTLSQLSHIGKMSMTVIGTHTGLQLIFLRDIDTGNTKTAVQYICFMFFWKNYMSQMGSRWRGVFQSGVSKLTYGGTMLWILCRDPVETQRNDIRHEFCQEQFSVFQLFILQVVLDQTSISTDC